MTDASPIAPRIDPPMAPRSDPRIDTPIDVLIRTVALLRAPDGCPWDAEQTHASLVPYLLEESHELIEAIEAGGREELLEELGDVLYQVVFHADLAAHTAGEDFDLQDVAARLTAKLEGRHPHVFGDLDLETADEVAAAWDGFKAAEKPGRTSVLDGIPQGMPALALADKVLGRAQKIGLLDTDGADFPLPLESEDELGPLLLAIVSAAKARGLDSERALRTAVRGLQDEIRAAEHESAADAPDRVTPATDFFDAGIIALPSQDD